MKTKIYLDQLSSKKDENDQEAQNEKQLNRLRKLWRQKPFYLWLTVFVFAASLFLIPSGFAQPENDFDLKKEGLWQEIEKLKNDQLLFQEQIGVLENQKAQVEEEVIKTKELLNLTEIKLSYLEHQKEIVTDQINQKKRERAKIIKKIYIQSKQDPLILTIFSSDKFTDLLKNLDYNKKIAIEMSKDLRNVNKELDELKDETGFLDYQSQNLASSKIVLEQKIQMIANQIEATKDNIEKAKISQVDLEIKFLNLLSGETKNKRDFIENNFVDFRQTRMVNFSGGGTDHGVGLSQYGAKKLALDGFSHQAILKYYYQGTDISGFNTKDTLIRVLLSSPPDPGRIYGRAGNWKIEGLTPSIEPNGWAEIRDKFIYIFSPSGTQIQIISNPGIIRFVPDSDFVLFEIGSKPMFNLYRGTLIVTRASSGLEIINELPLEEYLYGVVPAEVSCLWPEAALKAQAIAARSYAFTHLRPESFWDVDDTTRYQVYLGYNHEAQSTNKAVDETKGQMVTFNGKIIVAYFFSSSGGWTENNENVWGGEPLPYLRGVASPNEPSPYASWQTTILAPTLKSILESLFSQDIGEPETIQIIKRGVSGRVMLVKITGNKGEIVLAGQKFKYLINARLGPTNDLIRSNLFGIRGE